ncbi:MAG: glycosyltransferase family 4 protein [Candidatus Omnitrophica bacterium]|nr:glycosyltransferase family 4 protein [Candidatus Omnitrophota bacterium]MBU4478029.1 glycosyltransferase family 4 protein [Candidatus Omnitrophota bacterium]MCG2703637.1 glycosyltransferase family 4 protein [Candidatus Omnitrophota bacterium]
MKILFITRESSEMPAVRVRCYGFAECFRKAGWETEVFSYADILGAKSGETEASMSALEKISYNLEAFKRLLPKDGLLFLQRCNYHSFAPLFLRLFNSRKLVFDLDDWEARENTVYHFGRLPSSKAEIVMRLLAKKSSLCVGASRFLVRFLSNYNKKVLYVPTGVDADIFKPAVEERDDGRVIISWVGTMHRPDNVENIRFLLECFNELFRMHDNVYLEIRGRGIYAPQVKESIMQNQLPNVAFKPWIAPALMPAYLQNIDIGVMPLIQDTKFNRAKSPTRLFEYMAAGKPVVASKIGEAGDIINDGESGFLATEKAEFVDRLGRLIRDSKLRKDMGRTARKVVLENYTLQIITRGLIEAVKLL